MTLGSYLVTCLTVFSVCIVPGYSLLVWRLNPIVKSWRRRRAGDVGRITK